MISAAAAWEALRRVPDPEIPAISVCDLGIVRDVTCDGDGVTVVVTPTYSGCPATDVIRASIRSTACKSLHRCLACGEPFEYFKAI